MKSTAVDEVTNAYKTFNKAIDKVLVHPPGPARWRACVDMWLSLSPRNKLDYKKLVKENAQTRTALTDLGVTPDVDKKMRKFGQREHTLRNALAMPHVLYQLIQRADPTAFTEKKNAALMHKALPEFTTRRVF